MTAATSDRDPVEAAGLAIVDEIAAAAEDSWIGALLVSTVDQAGAQLVKVPRVTLADPVNLWIRDGVQACVAQQVRPDPVTVAEAARRAGMTPPPALRGLLVSHLFAISSVDRCPVPGNADYYAEIIRAAHICRRAETAAEAIRTAGRSGDLHVLATVLSGHVDALRLLLAAEGVTL